MLQVALSSCSGAQQLLLSVKNNMPGWHSRDPRENNLARVGKRNRLSGSGQRAREAWQRSRESLRGQSGSVKEGTKHPIL